MLTTQLTTDDRILTTVSSTGQRQEAELGLYYYVARWYDPAIGRFIQADSIVPNPASAKGFDRYAYAYNNPLRYIDPSGHVPYGENEDDVCLPSDNGSCFWDPPTELDIGSLNDKPFRYRNDDTPVHTERDLYLDYLELWEHRNAWYWKVYGRDGAFTFDEYLSMLLLGESANKWPVATGHYSSEVREYYDFCKHLGLDPNSIYSRVSFIARHYQSADYAVGNPEYLRLTWASGDDNPNISATLTLIEYLINPIPEWTVGKEPNEPYYSANLSLLSPSLVKDMKKNGGLGAYASYFYYWSGGGNPFFVATGCVYDKVIKTGDINGFNSCQKP